MSDYKKVFQLPTTYNFNASQSQTYQVSEWLRSVMEQVAKANPISQEQGPTVTVIIEVLL